MLSLSDGTNIPRSAQTSGRTHEAHLASKVSHAGIRQWNKALALERQKSEAQEYLTDAVAMLSTSSWWDPTYFSARSKAPPTTEPWMQGSIPMDQTWRYFLCTECDTYLVRGRQQKRHICSAHPDNNKRSTSFSLKKFPDTRRFVYVHDITNSILFDCIDSTSLESLIKLRAADILTANATSVRLPRGDYASVQGFIYVSATDAQDPKELMTAAFDVFIQEKSTCPPEFRAEDATCVNKPWTAEGQDFLKVLAGKSKKTLFLTCCEYGWASVLARDQGNRKWEHTCEFGRDSGRVKAYGPCNTVKTRPVKSFLDLPPNWASRAWFWQRRQGLGDTQVQMWKAD
ncbi:hypothetical protein PLICRDRAFT_181261 [Plicaturopsis crispa FD-325 SS-3]|uniref:C2H2-type domain-containing protein n=1 Tax=Plicaturopsis crispa FD-325 SS-3 TaxID=944288 RepID=A0A0C9SPG3_PLICR|nr:hypothetical protein PLICRDRAFT_181261 [Plicaturopsis crispa FD-325 SS-3]